MDSHYRNLNLRLCQTAVKFPKHLLSDFLKKLVDVVFIHRRKMDYNCYNYNYVQLPSDQSRLHCNSTLSVMPNRFVYVNQNFQKPKVLVNPNFKKTVHINPNFKGTIHVNPNIMKLQDGVLQKKLDCDNNDNVLPNPIKADVPINNLQKPKSNERRESLHTKYKIVHANGENIMPKQKQCMKSRYKIDKRISTHDRRSSMKRIIKTRYKLLNTGIAISKSSFKIRRNNKLVSISGVLYKKTPNVLQKADLSVNKSAVTKKMKLFKINGKMYKLRRNMTSTNSQSNFSLSRNVAKKKLLLSQTRNFDKQIFSSKMRKCNIPCSIYRKFGKCIGRYRGTCFKIHNPEQIALCTRFLQGACRKKYCLLSHKVSAEKMPTCKFYLEGLCIKEDCPYLHVKISPKADICKDFLQGFCKKAKDCDKRHQFLCPDYEKTGSCSKKRCQYPHGTTVRKYNLRGKVAKNTIKLLKSKIDKLKEKRKEVKKGVECNDKNVRYYIDTTGNQNNLDVIANDDDIDVIQEISICDSTINLKKRKTLGDLPSFIPFGD